MKYQSKTIDKIINRARSYCKKTKEFLMRKKIWKEVMKASFWALMTLFPSLLNSTSEEIFKELRSELETTYTEKTGLEFKFQVWGSLKTIKKQIPLCLQD